MSQTKNSYKVQIQNLIDCPIPSAIAEESENFAISLQEQGAKTDLNCTSEASSFGKEHKISKEFKDTQQTKAVNQGHSKNSSGRLLNTTKVLYQKLGEQWYVFTYLKNQIYYSKVEPEQVKYHLEKNKQDAVKIENNLNKGLSNAKAKLTALKEVSGQEKEENELGLLELEDVSFAVDELGTQEDLVS